MTAAAAPAAPKRYAIRRLSVEAPWQWLAKGWADCWVEPASSFLYGLLFVGIGLAISWGLWSMGLEAAIPVAGAGFALLGPLLAVGLYEKSRRIEAGEALTWPLLRGVRVASANQLPFVGLFLALGFLAWGRIAQHVYALFTEGSLMPIDAFAAFVVTTQGGLAMLVVGTAVGAALAFALFAIAWLSVPFLMDREADFVTAMALSIEGVRKNTRVALLWAFLVALFTAVGVATFVGLVLIFPCSATRPGTPIATAWRRVEP